MRVRSKQEIITEIGIVERKRCEECDTLKWKKLDTKVKLLYKELIDREEIDRKYENKRNTM